MKHNLLSLAGALALTLTLLAGCQPDVPDVPSPSESQPIPTPSPAVDVFPEEPPVLDWIEEGTAVPEFLSPELQHLYLQACSAAQIFSLSSSAIDRFPMPDGSIPAQSEPVETVEINGYPYRISQGRYARWEDFASMLRGLFTSEYLDSLLSVASGATPAFTPTEDGRTAFLDADRGSDIFYEMAATPDEFVLIEEDAGHITFSLIGHYADLSKNQENGEDTWLYTEEYTIRLVRTDDGWRFAEFHLPY